MNPHLEIRLERLDRILAQVRDAFLAPFPEDARHALLEVQIGKLQAGPIHWRGYRSNTTPSSSARSRGAQRRARIGRLEQRRHFRNREHLGADCAEVSEILPLARGLSPCGPCAQNNGRPRAMTPACAPRVRGVPPSVCTWAKNARMSSLPARESTSSEARRTHRALPPLQCLDTIRKIIAELIQIAHVRAQGVLRRAPLDLQMIHKLENIYYGHGVGSPRPYSDGLRAQDQDAPTLKIRQNPAGALFDA